MNDATRTELISGESPNLPTIDELEATVPALALQALREAREATLAAGISVVWSDGASLWETAPDGTHRLLGADSPIRPRIGEL